MQKLSFSALALAIAGLCLQADAQPANDAAAHQTAAKKAAGTDFDGALARTCVSPDPPTIGGGNNARRVVPDRATWYAKPARMFDNLYWVGTRIHSAWALQTSDGIILIDTLYNYAVEPEIVGGFKTLGLDPAKIKYVIVSHAHGDHDEGARLLQDRYGAHVVMGAADWDTIESSTNMPGGAPRRDMVAADGQKITLGDTSVTIVTTPGHTPGTLSLIFPVKDHGKTLTVVYSGGTGFNFPHDAAHYDTYIASQRKIAAAAAAAGATIVMSNHSEFDNAFDRSRLVRLRETGEPHPYEIGAPAVARYFKVTEECALAARTAF
jgi:metallo-beta-lactamase class B